MSYLCTRIKVLKNIEKIGECCVDGLIPSGEQKSVAQC